LPHGELDARGRKTNINTSRLIPLLTFGARMTTLTSEGSYVPQKPTRPADPAKNEQGEYATFETALKKVLSVPHSALKAQLHAEKRVRRQRTKRASGHASRAKD